MLAHNYCASRAEEAYRKIKRFAKKDSVKISDVARHYRKLCNKIIQFGGVQKTQSTSNRDSAQYGFTKMNSTVNGKFYSPNNRLSKKTSLHGIVKVLTNNFRLTNDKDQIEEDEENEKEKSENMLDQVKRKNKLNIYVGGFETYTSKNPADIEKVKIYEGKMCSTFFLNSHSKKKNYEKSTHGQIDVRKIIKKEGGIFIPNDVVKIKSKDLKEFKELNFNFKSAQFSSRKITDISALQTPQTVMSTINDSPLMPNKKSIKTTPDVREFNANVKDSQSSPKIIKSYNSKNPSYGDFKLIPIHQHGQGHHSIQYSNTENYFDKDKSIYSMKSKGKLNTPTAACRPQSSYNMYDTNINQISSRNEKQQQYKINGSKGNSVRLLSDQNGSNYMPLLSSPSYIVEKNKMNFSTNNYNPSLPIHTENVTNTTKSCTESYKIKTILNNKSFKIINEQTHSKFGNSNHLLNSPNVKSMKNNKTTNNKKGFSNKKEAIMQFFNFFNKNDMYYD